MRYTTRKFSPSMVGVWDKDLNDYVRNPSGRKKLFYKEASAKKVVASLNAASKQSKEISTMTREEVQAAFLSDENLEYHVTGKEEGPKHLRPAPGWYPCRLDEIAEDGNVEIAVFTDDQPAGLWITVLKKNIPTAFRKPQEVTQ